MGAKETEVNLEQRKRWDEEEGAHWVAEAERFDRMLGSYGDAIIQAAAPEPGESALDIGCGNGALTLDLAARVGPAGRVTAVDVSGPMLGLARQRAAERSLGNITFLKSDAQVDDLGEGTFDMVASRFGVMFFEDPVAAFANLLRATKEGGRLAFACWQGTMNNEWANLAASQMLRFVPMPEMPSSTAPGPLSLADPEHTRGILEKAGWSDVDLSTVEAQQWMGADVDDALAFFKPTQMAKLFLGDADESTKEKAWAAVAEVLAERATDDGVILGGKAWLVTASR